MGDISQGTSVMPIPTINVVSDSVLESTPHGSEEPIISNIEESKAEATTGPCEPVDAVRRLPSPPSPPRRLPAIPTIAAPAVEDTPAETSPPSDFSPFSPSKAQAMFQSRLKAADANAVLSIKTAPVESRNELPPTPPTLTPDNMDTPGSSASTLLGEETESSGKDDFYKKPARRASEDSIISEKLALKQQLKLQIPASADHSLSHRRNAPAGLPLMQPLPARPRARRNSLPASPFVLISSVEQILDASPYMETPDHLLFTGLDSALRTQRMLDSPNDPLFPETPEPDSAMFHPVPIKMMDNLDDDDGYISDPGSAVVRCFAEPLRAGPQIQRGKQLPFPVRPTKAVPVSLMKTGSNPIALKQSRQDRYATLKRRYHDVPSKYEPHSPIVMRSPLVRSPVIPAAVFARRASLFDSNRVGVSSPLAQRPMHAVA